MAAACRRYTLEGRMQPQLNEAVGGSDWATSFVIAILDGGGGGAVVVVRPAPSNVHGSLFVDWW